jgi:hypothetical protein
MVINSLHGELIDRLHNQGPAVGAVLPNIAAVFVLKYVSRHDCFV